VTGVHVVVRSNQHNPGVIRLGFPTIGNAGEPTQKSITKAMRDAARSK
jgi:hypothetical protein